MVHFTSLKTIDEVRSLMQALPPVVALDTEYDGKDSRTAPLVSIVIATDGYTAFSIPAEFVNEVHALKSCKELRLQNFKGDYEILSRYGLDLIDTPVCDSMLLHHLVDENASHKLDDMCQEYFGDNYKEVFWGKYDSITEASESDRLEYECKDVCYTYQLVDIFKKKLVGRESLIPHVHSLAKALYRTEVSGIDIDLDLIIKTESEMSKRIRELKDVMRYENLIHCQTWEMRLWVERTEKARAKLKTEKGRANVKVKKPEFNFGSDKQLSWLIYDRLKIPVLKRTKRTPKGGGNNPAVDNDTFQLLAKAGFDLGSITEFKQLKNIYATFVLGMLARVENGKVFPGFNVNGAKTGRISHHDPNLANIPVDGPYRNFFLPPKGAVWVGADFEQLEVIVEANLTGDKNLERMLFEGLSKHDVTNQEMGLNNRALAKTVNFAMGYHCGPYKLKEIIGCSSREAEKWWYKYWEVYSGCRALKVQTDEEVLAGQPIRNIIGRLRHLDITGKRPWEIEKMQRQAYNFKIQGPGGDHTNEAFYLWSEHLVKTGHGAACWSVHDEILGWVYPQYAEEEKLTLKGIMESVGVKYNYKIPLRAKPYGPLDRWAKT